MEPLGPLDYDLTPAIEAAWGPVDCITPEGRHDSVQLYATWVCDHNGTFAKLYNFAPGQNYLSCVPPGAPDPKKSNGCSPNNMGHPCNAATGNKFLNERDYAGSGSFPLTITRYYNSAASNQTALGVGWVLSYERVLKFTPGKADFKAPDVATIQRADGSVLTFDFSNGVWVPDTDVRATLQKATDVAGNTSGWIFVDLLRDETETYNAAGKLVSIANRAGLTQSLTYDSSGRLASVSDAVGRALTVAYESGGRIAGITDPAGGIYAYSYDTAGNLAGATFPDGATRRYVYEDAHFRTR